jgi:hypothetical protein
VIDHVTLEVESYLMEGEIEWWKTLGAEEDPTSIRSDKYGARWIRGRFAHRPPFFLHLFPLPNANPAVPNIVPIKPFHGHVALDLGSDLDAALGRLAAEGWRITEGTPYWGARRYMVDTLCQHRVELMEFGPPQPRDWSIGRRTV